MKPLLEALYTHLQSTDFWTNLSSRVYFDHAEQGASFPYCVYFVVNDRYNYQFDSEFQETVLQFNIFDQSSSSINVLGYYDDLRSGLDWANLSITGYSCIKVEPEWAGVEYLEEEECWVCRAQYRVLWEKNS